MNKLFKLKINYFIKKLYIKKKKIAIAFSGGIDSNLLLYFYKNFLGKKIILIYIIHNVKKKYNNVIRNCKIISRINNLRIIFKKINIKKKKIKKLGVEGALRYYRYKKFFKILKRKKIKVLLIGHNNNDFIETFFINIFRGTGIYGLFSMKKIIEKDNIFFIRPFLKISREYLIEKILKNRKKIILIYDYTNNNLSILRNYIRNIIIKYFNNKINYSNSLNNFIDNLKEYSKILKDVANKDINDTGLKILNIAKLKKIRRKNLFIHFIKNYFKIPSKKWLEEFDKQIINNNLFIKKKNHIITSNKGKLLYKKMKILVQKYGGTSLGNKKKIKNVAKKIKEFIKKKYKLIVVVSAMCGTTNNLYKTCFLSKKFSDIILFTGEYISLGILCSYLRLINVKVNYLTSWQIPILTDSNFSFAKIRKIYTSKIYNYFIRYDVIIIPGFQGVNKKGEITTIGRGGSDATAIELSNSINSKCLIYTDVNGIYDKDPNIFKNCKLLKSINYKELMEVSSLGAKVFQLDSVINCIKKKVNTRILSSFSKFKNVNHEQKRGTSINFCDFKMKKNISIVLTHENMLTFVNNKNINLKIIKEFSKKKIIIDNLCFLKLKNNFFLSFSINRKIKFNTKYKHKLKKMIKVSLVGIGIKNYSNNFLKIISILKNRKVCYYCFTTSEIKISFLIKEKYKKKIIKLFNNFII